MATRSSVDGGLSEMIEKIPVKNNEPSHPKEEGFFESIKNRWNKWGENDPDGRFDAVAAIAGSFENEQARRGQMEMESVNALAQPYTGRNAKLIAPASIANTIYGYDLAKRKREDMKEESRLRSLLFERLLEQANKKK